MKKRNKKKIFSFIVFLLLSLVSFYFYKEEDFTVLLDLKGITVDSLEFAERLRKLSWQYKNIVFIIGGSYGVTEEVRENVKVVMAFSKLTFPHQLFRVILLEQIYRAFRINSNESYHK